MATSVEQLNRLVHDKASWIMQRLHLVGRTERAVSRVYESDEKVLYLGRQYRLWVEESGQGETRLAGGWLHVFVDKALAEDEQAARVRHLLVAWHRERARECSGSAKAKAARSTQASASSRAGHRGLSCYMPWLLAWWDSLSTVAHRDGTRPFKLAPLYKSIYSVSPNLQELLSAANRRYLEFLFQLEEPTPNLHDLAKMTASVQVNGPLYRGFPFFYPQVRGLLEVNIHGEHTISGLRNRDIHRHLPALSPAQVSHRSK